MPARRRRSQIVEITRSRACDPLYPLGTIRQTPVDPLLSRDTLRTGFTRIALAGDSMNWLPRDHDKPRAHHRARRGMAAPAPAHSPPRTSRPFPAWPIAPRSCEMRRLNQARRRRRADRAPRRPQSVLPAEGWWAALRARMARR